MPTRDHHDAGDDRPLEPREDRLLDASLGRRPVDGLEPDLRAEAEALGDLVRAAREGLAAPAPDPVRVADLRDAARDVAVAARSPLVTGGFWRHLQGGLRRSPLIRVAAASLLVHLAALPVLAWIHFSAAPEPGLRIRFEQPTEPLTAEPEPELLAPVELPLVPDQLDEPDAELPGGR